MSYFPWLTILVVFPIFAEDPLMQLKEDSKWIDVFDFHWRLGIDGLSLGSILLTGFITTLATLAAWPVTRNSRLFYFLMLAMYSGGSIFFLIGVLGMGLYGSNEPGLDLEKLINQPYPATLEILLYFGFLIAYAVKLPIIPLHTWLPDTHGEAHYSTCMLLAGILLKMGAYGLIRINMELLPHAHCLFSPWLVIIGAVQIIYAASTSLGIGSITNIGLNGAILQILSHGFIGATLFFLAGTACDRIRLVYLEELGGISIPMPKIFTMFSSFSMASLALPGMSGFVAELVMFYGYKLFHVPNENFVDSGPRELFLLICIFLPVIGIGIYPDFVLSLSVDRVETLLSNYYTK
ncbi:hypothetical protein BS78_K210800 [Paspalum vaginatum]|uniref:NADH:quinone oxidoreductase/Mrp antiporter transmembrane domain-containing protein n=1 Tax=Paspalum vaginatum TaxID=158149 RepID=A0A9W7X7B8_9POAL|nr:hypothetical protein BS78_K210800 [Paspalum vaginatum]